MNTKEFQIGPSGEILDVVARIDLTILAGSLRQAGQHPDLVAAVERAASAGSTREDLRESLACLKLIVQLADTSKSSIQSLLGQDSDSTIVGALFTQAVISYARATTTGGERPKLLGEGKLTDEQKAAHEEAMAFRNNVIAHFGKGERLPDGLMVREVVLQSLLLGSHKRKTQMTVFTIRTQNRASFSDRLLDLVEARLKNVEIIRERLLDNAATALKHAVTCDPALGPQLKSFQFDIDKFCPTPELVNDVRGKLGTIDLG